MNYRKQDIMTDSELLQHVRSRFTYDPETGQITGPSGHVLAGGRHKKGYLGHMVWYNGKFIYISAHRLAWALAYGRWPKVIDHVNGDRTDHRLCNLREVTPSENKMNTLYPWKPNTITGVPGVSPHSRHYRTRIQGKEYFFSDPYEAFYHATMCGKRYREN